MRLHHSENNQCILIYPYTLPSLPPPHPTHTHTHKHTPMPLRFPPPPFCLHIRVAKVSYGLVGGGGGASRRKMICCGYECLTDPLECSPSIRLHPPTCSLPPITSPCSLSPSRSQLLRPGLSPPTSPRPGRSGDGGLSAELEQKAGAPNLPDGALEAEGRGTLLFYHLCVSIIGTHFELTFTARYVRAVNTLSRMFPLHGK